MSTVRVGNDDFFYEESGSGDPLIFVHGSVCDYRNWQHQVAPFSSHFHVVTYSRRYHFPNNNNHGPKPYVVQQHVDDLITLIDALGFEKVRLVGSSYGGYTALIAALRHPDRVAVVVANEPPIIPLLVANPNNPLQFLALIFRDFRTGRSLMNFGMKAIQPATQQLRLGNLEAGVRFFVNGVLGSGGFDRTPEWLRRSMIDNALALKYELEGPGFPPFDLAQAAQFAVPCLLASGQNSPYLFQAITGRLRQILTRAQHAVIPAASHGMHTDNPVAYNAVVLPFLMKHG